MQTNMNQLFIRTFILFLILCSSTCFEALYAQGESNFYDPDRLAEIRLTFKTNDWAEELDSLRIYGNELLLGQAKIDGQAYKNIGVRFRGTRSFKAGSKRNALHIKLNFIDRSQNHQGYKTVKLSNALRDPSMVREVLGFEIARKYMAAPQANFVKVYVNDQYYGLFVNVESVSGQFLESNFGSSENTFFECNPDIEKETANGCKKDIFSNLEYEEDVECYFSNYELKSEHGWDDLMKLTKSLNQSPADISKVLNVDRTLWMLAYNNVLVNLSSYTGDHSENYYLYKDDKGMFNPIVWDLNLAFGSYKNVGGGSDLDLAGLQKLDPLLHENNPSKPLISKLLANPKYKMIYLSHVRTILNENFRKGQYLDRAEELQRVMQKAYYDDKNHYYDGADFEKSLISTVGKRSKIPGISELMEARASYLKKHPSLAVLPVKVSEVTVESRPDMGKDIVDFKITARVEKFAKNVKIMYRFAADETYQSMQMKDDGKSRDGKAGDDVFGVQISDAKNAGAIEYYIVAENKGTVTFSPSNYMHQPYTANLEDLNN